jgi:membrane protease YdiL (CAAX protease family)
MSAEKSGPALPLISVSDVHLRVWPFVAVLLLAAAGMVPGALAIKLVTSYLTPAQQEAMPWLAGYTSETGFLIGSLICIGFLSKGRFGEFGLRLPRGKSYLKTAFLWGVFFGLLMVVVDHLPNLIAHVPPAVASLTRRNIIGQLVFEGIFPGIGEEVLFRGLLVTYLSSRISGRIRFLGFNMHIAGVLIALMFALAHMSNFWSQPFWQALGQQVYAFGFGVFYAYWYEKSGSLAAAMVGHNVGNFVESAIEFLLASLWR